MVACNMLWRELFFRDGIFSFLNGGRLVTVTVTNKVLVVDDDPDARIFISNLLTSHGFDPIRAENRTEGLRKAIDKKPAVIIIDMMMSKQQGVKMYRQIRTHEKFKNLPVIMLSTLAKRAFYQLQHIEYTLPHQGFPKPEGYLSKPPEAAELIYTVKKIIKNQPKRKTQCL